MRLNIRSIFLYLTATLYVGSLLLPGLTETNHYANGSTQTMHSYGYEVLLIGWGGIISGLLSWYGYILGIVGFFVLQAGRTKKAFICFVIGLLFGLEALLFQAFNLKVNMVGAYSSWDSGMGTLNIGYYLWIFALCVLTAQAWFMYRTQGRR